MTPRDAVLNWLETTTRDGKLSIRDLVVDSVERTPECLVLRTEVGSWRVSVGREPDLRVAAELAPYQVLPVTVEVGRYDLEITDCDNEVTGDVWCRLRAGPTGDWVSGGDWQPVVTMFAPHEAAWPPNLVAMWSQLFLRGTRVRFEFQNRGDRGARVAVNLYGRRREVTASLVSDMVCGVCGVKLAGGRVFGDFTMWNRTASWTPGKGPRCEAHAESLP